MKKYQLPLLLLWVFLEYNVLGVILYWVFQYEVPFDASGIYALPVVIGMMIIMPIVGYFLIVKGETVVNKLLGYMSLISWGIVLIRFLTLFN
jgi:hypothetical protein